MRRSDGTLRRAGQVWRLGLARRNATCVLTGKPIAVGDSVYRPRSVGPYEPANKDRMTLAEEVAPGEVREQELQSVVP
ncbi:DUF3331 domain-containing protein [Paraburkholderia hospita]|uniref:DUF3331 domain-containing protein n=1 Tax=Paraburkholderia hospita TaxID=169430 RepID=UPI00141EC642